ncbi:zinc finger protein 569-like [Neocloeon triangulifer]|uniref:zinc finger protein 569-like n=1 Tax=Neocloeon triangulifer TaxID=2078957 RepID=UPI00286EB904|nr:zinc finger protein 569-like [Neocloeon triangulifer]
MSMSTQEAEPPTKKLKTFKSPGSPRRDNKSIWELANSKKRCFICTKLLVGNPSFLQKALTKHSNISFATCLRTIADNKFPLKIERDDRCCSSCASLLQKRASLLRDLDVVNNTLFAHLKASSAVRALWDRKNNSSNDDGSIEIESVSISPVNDDSKVSKNAAEPPSQVIYQCGSCKKLFYDIKELSGHNCLGKKAATFTVPSSMNTVRSYPCVKCNATFTTVLALSSHAKTHESPAKLEKFSYSECKKCKLFFPNQERLKEHKETHNKFQCSSCKNQFKDREAFDKHISLLAKLQPDFCITCNKIFDSKELLTSHLLETHGESNPSSSEHMALRVVYACTCCNSELPDAKNMKEHKLVHKAISLEDLKEEIEYIQLDNDEEPQCDAPLEMEEAKPTPFIATSLDHSYSMDLPEPQVESLDAGDECQTEDEPQEKESEKVVEEKVEEKQIKPCIYECGMCDVRANSIQNLLEHFQMHKDQPISCKHCKIKMPTISALSKHLQYHVKSGQGIECLICRAPLTSKDHLMKHMHDVHKLKQQCMYCGEQFQYTTEVSTHKNLHPESRHYMCLFCDERFATMVQLDKHQNLLHRDPKCNVCGKEILDRRKLREHELRHHKELNPCTLCERIFKTSSGLKNHMATHTGEYKYICDICKKGFCSRNIFREHVNNHLEYPEMLYKCRYCDKQFSYQGSWWIHEKWHKNPFPYQCKLCGKRLRHSSILATHMRKHRGEKPYKCPHCNLSVTSASTIKRHIMLHTGKYDYNCLECNKGFTTKQKYHQHRYVVHGISIPIKRKMPYKISLGIPNQPGNSYDNETLVDDDAELHYIIEDLEGAGEVVLQNVLEIEADEQQQAVAALTLLEENSSWTDGR